MQNAPFGLNPWRIAYFKKVCKSVRFFAHVPEMTFPDWQTGAVAEPDWGVGMQVSRRGFLTVEVLSPGFAIFCFLVLSSTMPKLSSLCNLPNPGRSPHLPTAAPPIESGQPPGFSRIGRNQQNRTHEPLRKKKIRPGISSYGAP
jgi:hypothetical protein